MRQAADGALSTTRVPVDEFVENLRIPDGAKSILREEIRSRVPDPLIRIDDGVATRVLMRRRFEGSNGLHLSVPASSYDDMVTVRDPDGQNPYEVVIRTEKWDEIPRRP